MPIPPFDAREAGPRRGGIPPLLEALMGQDAFQPNLRGPHNRRGHPWPDTPSWSDWSSWIAPREPMRDLFQYLEDQHPSNKPAQGPQGLSEPHLPGSYDRTRPHIEELLRNQALHDELLLGLEGDSYYPEDPESPSNLEGGEPARERRWLLGKGERAQRRAARQAARQEEEQAILAGMGGSIPAGDIMVGQRLRQGLPIDPRVKLAGRRGVDFVPDDPDIWGVRNAAEPRRHSGRLQF